ncbi:aldo/keto reductase family protein [Treponema primitia]|uniref:aldo/keto reductase family protein n=1 Tax=Treponema primitia TaxID=88058 RepID=UPI0002555567|nr:aldo/keto reductase [Treponema primitia]
MKSQLINGIGRTPLPVIKLSNDVKIPVIGNGPGGLRHSRYDKNDNKLLHLTKRIYNKLDRKIFKEREYINAVCNAFKIGFTLFDYSAAYKNEQLIGKAIQKSGISRSDLFLTTRVTNARQVKGNIREQFLKTLEYYRTDYVDLYMFHWPVPGFYLDTWKQIEQLYKEGYCRAIGVANCHQHHLEEIFKIAEFIPQVNQFEIHPLFTQKPLIAYCKLNGIAVEAYTPIARFDERLIELPRLKKITQKYKKSIVQIVLKWHIQNGIIPVVRSLNKKHQIKNISIFDFELTEEEINIIDSFNINSRLRYDPDNCDFSVL